MSWPFGWATESSERQNMPFQSASLILWIQQLTEHNYPKTFDETRVATSMSPRRSARWLARHPQLGTSSQSASLREERTVDVGVGDLSAVLPVVSPQLSDLLGPPQRR